ncbi:MAG: hypothetical protein ACM3N7_13055, partial [Planctomycetaceae bacterium]
FYPPDFGGAHRSGPRLHVTIYPHYFPETNLGYKSTRFINLDFPLPFVLYPIETAGLPIILVTGMMEIAYAGI